MTLIEQLERADGADRGLDRAIALSMPERFFDAGPRHEYTTDHDIGQINADGTRSLPGNGPDMLAPRYTDSIDAAMTLATGLRVRQITQYLGMLRWYVELETAGDELFGATGRTLPTAFAAAALRARSQGGE